MNLRGNVEMLTRSEVRGWAVDLDQPTTPVAIELIVGGRRIAATRAVQPRPDLSTLGLSSVNIGFSLAVPAGTMFDLRLAEVRVVGMNAKLPGMIEAARYEGVLEQISGTLITGWAWHSWMPEERVDVLIRNSQNVIGRVTADRRRADLLAAGMGDGRYGFEFELRKLPDWHRIDTTALMCVFEPNGVPLHDLRPGMTRAPVLVNTSRTLYSAPAPAQPAAPAPAPAPSAIAPPPVAHTLEMSTAAPVPAAPVPAAPTATQSRVSAWRARKSQRAAANKPAPVQLVRFIQPPAPVQPPAEKPLSPELLEAMRDALNFGEDDPFV
jgi:hypothetical protein